ncbi:MAG: SprT-like domain-containing protein [Myxococcota bacterium]|nr:SprT-like domain-containing protein [Myxococcota bacterium]
MNLRELSPFLPGGTLTLFEAWLCPFHFRIIVTRPRQSKLGDFRMGPGEERSVITINGDLEPHQFALTLTHEIAHLMTFAEHGYRIRPHGPEWKRCFGYLLRQLAAIETLPLKFRRALRRHAIRPKSASVLDPELYRIILELQGVEGQCLDHVPIGAEFVFRGLRFRKLSTARSRCECRELTSGQLYRISRMALIDDQVPSASHG